jgi:VWFA-related protein
MFIVLTKHCLRWTTVAMLALGLVRPALAQTGLDVVVHYVEGQPAEGQMAYDVAAYVSVSDNAGNPIKDLVAADFALTEDSQKVDILYAGPAADEPINLILLLDTSGSMSGLGISAARSAASNFVSRLSPEDRVAVVAFDDSTRILIDFTSDHNAARNELNLLDATRNAGTCLYDAAYQAVQMTATVPSGRRAVILFTDGVDETRQGGPCSTHTPDDVINLAREGGTRTPIYTLGLGAQVDQNALKRLAENTGGRFLYSSDPSQLDSIFLRLSDSLRAQYALRYLSTAGPGAHTLAVTAKYLSAQDTDTRTFLLPNFPLRLSFLEPAEAAQVSGVIALKAEASGQGQTIQAVIFRINDVTMGSDETSPYEVQVDLAPYPQGDLTIVALAQSADGTELARVTRTVKVGAPAPASPTPTPIPAAPTPNGKVSLFIILAIVGLVGLVVVVGIVFLFFFLRRRAEEKRRDEEWNRQVGGIGVEPTAIVAPAPDRTMDAWEVSADALGMLAVLASDDASIINHRFEIMRAYTTLGRAADNDIPFPKDSAVSRHHAQVEERNGGLWISEVESVDASGSKKRPTYGTFVNETQIGLEPVLLAAGNEVRLGKRVRLRFEPGPKLTPGDARTLDEFAPPPDPDATHL